MLFPSFPLLCYFERDYFLAPVQSEHILEHCIFCTSEQRLTGHCNLCQSGKKKNWVWCKRVETSVILTCIYACTFMVNVSINISNNDELNLNPRTIHNMRRSPFCGKARHKLCQFLCALCLKKNWKSCSAPSSEELWLDAVRRGGRPKLHLPIFKCAVILLSVFLLDFSAFMQKQLRIWKAKMEYISLSCIKVLQGSSGGLFM